MFSCEDCTGLYTNIEIREFDMDKYLETMTKLREIMGYSRGAKREEIREILDDNFTLTNT